MKTLTIIAAAALLALPVNIASGSYADAQVRVRGYTRADGTYVAPHVRSSPNSTTTDNYGSRAPAAPRPLYGAPAPSRTQGAYANCSAARADGAANIRRGEPGYGSHLDRDGDGVACER